MREIKFRAWDKGRMIEPMGLLMRDAPQWLDKLSSEAILMQYTGLRDKNGKEIYEGDIVKIDGGLKWICKWSSNHARFFFDTGLHKTYDFNSQEPNNFEVIGNLYDYLITHPEWARKECENCNGIGVSGHAFVWPGEVCEVICSVCHGTGTITHPALRKEGPADEVKEATDE